MSSRFPSVPVRATAAGIAAGPLQALLASIDRSTRIGARDHAILRCSPSFPERPTPTLPPDLVLALFVAPVLLDAAYDRLVARPARQPGLRWRTRWCQKCRWLRLSRSVPSIAAAYEAHRTGSYTSNLSRTPCAPGTRPRFGSSCAGSA